MKMKKIVSAFSALAMTVTAMAGLAVTANAEKGVLYSVDYTDASTWSVGATDGWSKTSGGFDPTIGIESGVGMTFYAGEANGKWRDYVATKNFDESFDGTIDVKLTFNTGTCQSNDSYVQLVDANGNNILKLTSDRSDTEFAINDVVYKNISEESPSSAGATTDSLRSYILQGVDWDISANINFATHSGTVTIIYEMDATHTYYLAYNELFTFDESVTSLNGINVSREGANLQTSNAYQPQIVKTVEIQGELPAPEPEVTEATVVEVPDTTGVKAFKVTEFALNGTAPTWSITATPAEGDAQIQTIEAKIANVEAGNVSLGLIIDNVPENVTVSATLGY